MKRLHVHVGVADLDKSIGFYTALFGAEPVKTKSDYAKWMLDDPRINFAISVRPNALGVEHLGVQVDEDRELDELRDRIQMAEADAFDEGETVCCYARSDKSWVRDPSGVVWEAFRTMEDAAFYSSTGPEGVRAAVAAGVGHAAPCCGPPGRG